MTARLRSVKCRRQAERAARDRVQRAKVGLSERGAGWEQSTSARRMRWQTAMAEIDALDAGWVA